MKFIIDAQLPPALSHFLNYRGHDAIHTLDLPLQNDTPDQAIRELATGESRIVITKDSDFYYSFVLYREPPKLVLVKTGNLGTKALITLFAQELDQLLAALTNYDFIVMDRTGIQASDEKTGSE